MQLFCCTLLTVFQIVEMPLMLSDVTACQQTYEHFFVCIPLLGLRLLNGSSKNAKRIFGDSWRSKISTRRRSNSSPKIWHLPDDRPLPQASVCHHFELNSVIVVLHHFQVNISAVSHLDWGILWGGGLHHGRRWRHLY